MKYLLVAQIEVPEKITSWEIPPGDRDVSDFFDICLAEIKGARINGFTCARLDGSDQEQALRNCAVVAESDDVLALIGN